MRGIARETSNESTDDETRRHISIISLDPLAPSLGFVDPSFHLSRRRHVTPRHDRHIRNVVVLVLVVRQHMCGGRLAACQDVSMQRADGGQHVRLQADGRTAGG